MAEQENVTWEELEQIAKNKLKGILEEGMSGQMLFEACQFILSRNLKELKRVEKKTGNPSSIYAEEE